MMLDEFIRSTLYGVLGGVIVTAPYLFFDWYFNRGEKRKDGTRNNFNH